MLENPTCLSETDSVRLVIWSCVIRFRYWNLAISFFVQGGGILATLVVDFSRSSKLQSILVILVNRYPDRPMDILVILEGRNLGDPGNRGILPSLLSRYSSHTRGIGIRFTLMESVAWSHGRRVILAIRVVKVSRSLV
jgi:hypothetical protein